MTHVEVVLGWVLLGVVHAGANAVPRVQRTFPVSTPSLAVSAGCGFDDGRLNAFLAAALLHVMQDAAPVHAPACASVVSSTAFLGFDAGVLGGLDAGGVG